MVVPHCRVSSLREVVKRVPPKQVPPYYVLRVGSIEGAIISRDRPLASEAAPPAASRAFSRLVLNGKGEDRVVDGVPQARIYHLPYSVDM